MFDVRNKHRHVGGHYNSVPPIFVLLFYIYFFPPSLNADNEMQFEWLLMQVYVGFNSLCERHLLF